MPRPESPRDETGCDCDWLLFRLCSDAGVGVRCGALGAEFEGLGPFYLMTAERLGRLHPDEVAAIVRRTPDNVSDLFAGVPDEELALRPSPSDW